MPQSENYAKNDYRIITSSAIADLKYAPGQARRGQYMGGAAISIHTGMAYHIRLIERLCLRIVKITLGREEARTPLTFLVTYTHHQGCKQQEKKLHIAKVNEAIEGAPKNAYSCGAQMKMGN